MAELTQGKKIEMIEVFLFEAGREVSFALPRHSSPLRPKREELRVAATSLGLSINKARKALGFYIDQDGFAPETGKEKVLIIKQQ